MDVFTLIKENPEQFSPKKEFKKYKPKEGWNTDNYDVLNQQLSNISKISTNGQSVSYHDIIDDNLNDGYLNDMGINKEELKHIGNGIYQDELISGDDSLSIIGAVKSYKIIKQNVAQFGALCNAFVALTIHHTWELEQEEKQKYLDLVLQFKHILCQDGLSNKHNAGKLDINTSKIIQDAFYNTPDNKLKTKEEYINLLKQVNLSDEIVNTIINLFWREPLVGINKILNEIVPTYRITRRGTNISLLENMTKLIDEQSLQARMIL